MRRLMPFTALKLSGVASDEAEVQLVVRCLMPFTALKHLQHNNKEANKPPVVRRLMPFTALKLGINYGINDRLKQLCAA